MKRDRQSLTRFALLAAAAVVVLTGCQQPAGAAPWRFVALSDDRASVGFGHPGYEVDQGINRSALTKLIARINEEHVDLVLFPGDAVYGEKPPKKGDAVEQPPPGVFKRELTAWTTMMNGLNCPWYFAPGNHETYRETNAAELREVFTAAGHPMPTNGPAGLEQVTYSFDHQNAHFVALNSDVTGHNHHVQTAWLGTDLAANHQPHVFVMAHEPAFSVRDEPEKCLAADEAARDLFWQVLTRFKVDAYFCGHEHLVHHRRPVPGSAVLQVITGRAGAPAEKLPGAQEVQPLLFVIVTVDGDQVTYHTETANGQVVDTF